MSKLLQTLLLSHDGCLIFRYIPQPPKLYSVSRSPDSCIPVCKAFNVAYAHYFFPLSIRISRANSSSGEPDYDTTETYVFSRHATLQTVVDAFVPERPSHLPALSKTGGLSLLRVWVPGERDDLCYQTFITGICVGFICTPDLTGKLQLVKKADLSQSLEPFGFLPVDGVICIETLNVDLTWVCLLFPLPRLSRFNVCVLILFLSLFRL